MRAINIAQHRVLWERDMLEERRTTHGIDYSIPLITDDRIPVLSLDRFVVLDEATGNITADQKHQRRRSKAFAKKGVAYGDTVAFVSESGPVAVFDGDNGDLLWVRQYGAEFHESAVADGRLVVGGADGSLWIFSANE